MTTRTLGERRRQQQCNAARPPQRTTSTKAPAKVATGNENDHAVLMPASVARAVPGSLSKHVERSLFGKFLKMRTKRADGQIAAGDLIRRAIHRIGGRSIRGILIAPFLALPALLIQFNRRSMCADESWRQARIRSGL